LGDTLICPRCNERVWVREIQIPLVTCPKCLAQMVNPNAREAADAAAPLEYRRWRQQVIPVERQAVGDIWGTTVLLGILAAVLVVGGILLLKMTGMNALSIILPMPGLAIAGFIWLLITKTKTDGATPLYVQQAEDETAVLDYAHIPEEGSIGGFIGGFILAMGFCLLAMIGIFATARPLNRVLAIAALVVGAGAFVFCSLHALHRQRHGGGFYGGVGTGLFLGAASCGPCSQLAFE